MNIALLAAVLASTGYGLQRPYRLTRTDTNEDTDTHPHRPNGTCGTDTTDENGRVKLALNPTVTTTPMPTMRVELTEINPQYSRYVDEALEEARIKRERKAKRRALGGSIRVSGSTHPVDGAQIDCTPARNAADGI